MTAIAARRRHSCRPRRRLSIPVQLFTAAAAVVCLLLLPCSSAQASAPTPFNVDGFLSLEDLKYCYEALQDADRDNDNQVDNDEYVQFSQTMNPNLAVIADTTRYDNMPLAFKAAFLRTACLCSLPDFGGNETALSCCFGSAAHLRVTQERLYLYAACSYNLAAADTVRAPSQAPTPTPTVLTTERPTNEPTAEPSMAATTLEPTPAPSLVVVDPTPAPTVQETDAPTVQETDVPTLSATDAPTAAGADAPTASPTPADAAASPTISPSFSAAPIVTASPNSSPVAATPTPRPTTAVVVNVQYGILVEDGIVNENRTPFITRYSRDLRRSMNLLAPQVLEETEFGGSNSTSNDGRRRRRRQQRRLQARRQARFLTVAYDFPTNIESLTKIDCPDSASLERDLCQNVSATVTLLLSGDDASNADAIRSQYETALSQAIAQGDLQAALDETNPNSPVTILDGSLTTSSPDAGAGIGAGGAVGIAVGVLVLVLISGLLVLSNRKKHQNDDAAEMDKEPVKDVENDIAVGYDAASSIADKDVYIEEGSMAAAASGSGGILLGAQAPNYGRNERREYDAMDMGEDVMAEPGMDDDHHTTASSEAGNSGWSSSAGLSSYNTGSMDDSMDAAMATGTTLAAIGGASALSRAVAGHKDDTETGASESEADIAPEIARTQLDDLIEAGDWAAVGATAALLAAASDSASMDSKSHATGRSERSRDTTQSGVDSARAAELDQLIDAGDWEGVVLAAAKFESAESGADTDTDQVSLGADDSEAGASSSRTGTNTAQSADTSISDSVSQNVNREAIREDVIDLVKRVVPEEIDNVDQMLSQFRGREEELVETLKTMQERSAAQKAREVNQKSAKLQARRTVQQGAGLDAARAGVEPMSQTPETSSGDLSGRSGDRSSIASVPSVERRTALESAIEAGDWEAVGAAAAMMSDADTGSGDSADISQLNEALSSVENSQRSMRSEMSETDTARAARMDALVDNSDWEGVVAATKKLTDESKPVRSQEEEDALAEADAWMKIAEDTKEGATDAGASDAAEWAIQKSLSQLNEEERQQKKKEPSGDDEDEV